MLGPGDLTRNLADLGADIIKVEPPQGDYGRRMTWPIVNGVSLLFLHVARGKRSIVLDLRTEEGVDIFKELVRDADAVVEAMRPGGLDRRGLGYEELKKVNPKIVFMTISGYGMTGPYRDMPSHGIAYDVWAGIVQPKIDDEGFAYMPEHVSIGINAGPVYGALGLAGRCHAGARDRRGLPDGDRAVRLRRRDRLAAQRDVQGVRAARVGSDRQRGRQLRAARAGHRGHGGGCPLPVLRDEGRQVRLVHGVRARVLEELLRRCRPRRPVREVAGLAVRRPCARQPRAASDPARHLRDEDERRVDRVRAKHNTPICPRTHRRRWPTIRSSRTGWAGCPRRSSAPRCCRARSRSSTASCRSRRRRRRSASTPTTYYATFSGGTTPASAPARKSGALG